MVQRGIFCFLLGPNACSEARSCYRNPENSSQTSDSPGVTSFVRWPPSGHDDLDRRSAAAPSQLDLCLFDLFPLVTISPPCSQATALFCASYEGDAEAVKAAETPLKSANFEGHISPPVRLGSLTEGLELLSRPHRADSWHQRSLGCRFCATFRL